MFSLRQDVESTLLSCLQGRKWNEQKDIQRQFSASILNYPLDKIFSYWLSTAASLSLLKLSDVTSSPRHKAMHRHLVTISHSCLGGSSIVGFDSYLPISEWGSSRRLNPAVPSRAFLFLPNCNPASPVIKTGVMQGHQNNLIKSKISSYLLTNVSKPFVESHPPSLEDILYYHYRAIYENTLPWHVIQTNSKGIFKLLASFKT